MTDLSRRTFLGRGVAGGVGIALAGAAGQVFGSSPASGMAAGSAGEATTRAELGYGPPIDDPAGLLALPAGFSYTVAARAGVTTLDSGHPTPDRSDGTGAFVRHGGNGSVLVVNHEMGNAAAVYRNTVPHLDGLTYDAGVALGGTTTLEIDKDGNRVREYVSLAGTFLNCAGGKTPWHTWLTCEETEAVPTATNGLQQRHGYVFEVDPYDPAANVDPRPLKFLGRFAHEALAVDPDTGTIYETEDAISLNGLLYRWTPPESALPLEKGSLRTLPDDAGTFEAMRALAGGALVPDLSVAVVPGTTYDVEWVTVPDRDATAGPIRGDVTTGSRSRKLEGCWWGDGGAYIVASFARTAAPDRSKVAHDGQVWFLDPLAQTIMLVLRFAFTPLDDETDPDGPDNITVSPYGGVILAEDGDGVQHLVGATEDGETFFFARNQLNGSEFAGPTFSQNKKTLFANIYDPGIVFAITGPWRKA